MHSSVSSFFRVKMRAQAVLCLVLCAVALSIVSADTLGEKKPKAPQAPSNYSVINCSSMQSCAYDGANGTAVLYKCSNAAECKCGNAEYCSCEDAGTCFCENSKYCNCKDDNGMCQAGKAQNLFCGEDNGMCCYNSNLTKLLSQANFEHTVRTADNGTCGYGEQHKKKKLKAGAIVGIVMGSTAFLAGAVVLSFAIGCMCGRGRLHCSRGKCSQTSREEHEPLCNETPESKAPDAEPLMAEAHPVMYDGNYGAMVVNGNGHVQVPIYIASEKQ